MVQATTQQRTCRLISYRLHSIFATRYIKPLPQDIGRSALGFMVRAHQEFGEQAHQYKLDGGGEEHDAHKEQGVSIKAKLFV